MNGILKYLNLYWCHFPRRSCPFSCKSFNLSWIQIGCFIGSAYRECCLSLAPQNPLLLFLPVSLASIVLRSEASCPFVAVSSGGTRAGGDHWRQEEAGMMLLPSSSSPALCCTCSPSAPISKKAKSHVLSSPGSRKLAVLIWWNDSRKSSQYVMLHHCTHKGRT